jgi:hypothetical protein
MDAYAQTKGGKKICIHGDAVYVNGTRHPMSLGSTKKDAENTFYGFTSGSRAQSVTWSSCPTNHK